MLNLILSRFRLPIVVVQKQEVLHILSVYLYLELSSMQSAYDLLYYLLRPVWLYLIFPTLSHNCGIWNVCFDFL